MIILKILFPCRFNNPNCQSNPFGCKCGKGGDSTPSAPDPTKVAQANVDAQVAAIPQAMQLSYNNLVNPNYGLDPTTAAYEAVRQKYYPTETAVRNQLGQNVLGQLQNPMTAEQYVQQIGQLQGGTPQGMNDLQNAITQQVMSQLQGNNGITAEQQAAINARRQLAQAQSQEALRTRQNLGGSLYGGRSVTQEGRMVNELQNQFAEEDIDREAAARQQALSNASSYLPQLLQIDQNSYNRASQAIGQEQTSLLNAMQQALPFLQLLYPDVGLQSPQFINPVASADNVYSGNVTMAQQAAQNQAAQQASNNELMGSIFQGLGSIAAAPMTGGTSLLPSLMGI